MQADNTVYVAIELSVSSWLVAARLPGVEKSRLHRLEGGDAAALLKTIAELVNRHAKGNPIGVQKGPLSLRSPRSHWRFFVRLNGAVSLPRPDIRRARCLLRSRMAFRPSPWRRAASLTAASTVPGLDRSGLAVRRGS
jgi:hypothetical protein